MVVVVVVEVVVVAVVVTEVAVDGPLLSLEAGGPPHPLVLLE